MILLTPGPANTTEEVKRSLCVEDTCHRERAFCALLEKIRNDLVRLAGGLGSHEAVLFTGSGTCAVEAAIGRAVPPSGRLLVLCQGDYGKRMVEMSAILGVPCESLESRPDAALSLAALAEALATGRFTHLAIVHHETTTGLLNPLEEIAALAEEHGVALIVDAISSFGGRAIDLAETPVDLLIGSANKCLQGMPGLSFVIVRRAVLEQMDAWPARSFYTDLLGEFHAVRTTGQMRFTPAVQVAFALRRALAELEKETVEGRSARYSRNWSVLQSGMASAGFRKLLPDAIESRLLTTYRIPDHPGYAFEAHHDRLLDEGFVIYPGKPHAGPSFRLGNIGAIGESDIRAFLAANLRVLEALGVAPPLYATD